jgi:hypothetical protein
MQSARDPFVAALLDCDLRLAEAEKPAPRVEGLAELAQRLESETRKVLRGAGARDLVELAQLYEKVVRGALLPAAKTLTPEQRRPLLIPVADRLRQAARDADDLIPLVGESEAGSLRFMAAVGRDADKHLCALVEEKVTGLFPAAPLLATVLLTLPTERARTILSLEDDPRAVWLLRRNRDLISLLVNSGIALASEEDGLKRADQCGGLAKQLVGEIRQAAVDLDDARVLELGDHLNALLKRGIAPNLTIERLGTNLGSARDMQIRRVGAQVKELANPLEALVANKADLGALRLVLQFIHDGQAEVEFVLKRRHLP